MYVERETEKTAGRVVGAVVGESAAVVDTTLQARMFEASLCRGLIHWLEGYRIKKREVVKRGSRFDYLLDDGRVEQVLELKSAVYLAEDGAARYPDTPSDRGLKHIETLNEIRSAGEMAALVFVAAHPEARYFMPNYEVDPRLRRVFERSVEVGLLVKSIKIHMEVDGSIVLDDADLPVVLT